MAFTSLHYFTSTFLSCSMISTPNAHQGKGSRLSLSQSWHQQQLNSVPLTLPRFPGADKPGATGKRRFRSCSGCPFTGPHCGTPVQGSLQPLCPSARWRDRPWGKSSHGTGSSPRTKQDPGHGGLSLGKEAVKLFKTSYQKMADNGSDICEKTFDFIFLSFSKAAFI